MQIKVFTFLLVLPILIFAQFLHAATGFVGNPIWIYPEFPREGELTTLSTLFHNGETQKLSGTVLFYDNNILLGKKSLTIAPGTVGTASIVFHVEPGNHVFSASAQGFQEISNSGSSKTYALPLGKAEMPKLFVTKNGSGSGVEAVGLKASAQAQPILNKVDEVEEKVINSIPESVKQPVVATVESLERIRVSTSVKLQSSVAVAKEKVEIQKEAAAQQVKESGEVAPSTKYINSPFASVRLFVAQLFHYIFSHAYLFYIALFGVLFLSIRAIIRKWKRSRHENRVVRKVASKTGKE
jgi:hypothetical protein